MGKIRIFELAKEMGISNKVIMQKLNDMGYGITTHFAGLDDDQIEKVKKAFVPKNKEVTIQEKVQNTETEQKTAEQPKKNIHIRRFDIPEEKPRDNRNFNNNRRPQGQNYNQGEQRPQGQNYNQGEQRPQGQNYNQGQQRPQGQNYNQGQPRPQGQNYNQGQPRPQGQNYNQGQPRPQGQNNNQGQPRPQGQGYNQGQPRPQGQGYNQGQPRPQGQGYNQGQPRPQGQGYNQGQPRPQGQGYNQGQPRPQGQGYNQGQPRPQGQGYNQGQPRPQGQGYNQGQPRPQGQGYNQGQNRTQAGPNKNLQIPKPPVVETANANDKKRPQTTQKKDFYKDKKNKFDQESPAEKKLQGKYNKKGKGKNRTRMQKSEEPIPLTIHKAVIGETVTVQELGKAIGKNAAEVIKKLFAMGVMATINQEIDAETAVIIASEFGAQVEIKTDKKLEVIEDYEDATEDLQTRPPVVTVMGHVDHGKTSLLDAIRETNVISTEAGGITQHIGAYQVEINNQKITFLDTPGHEAFTAMRARGAKVTDIAILVVAADDGIMPQTVEAINHAKAAKVPIIIAINKIDKPDANPDRVKQELTEHSLVPEEWGGDTICVNVSAKQRTGINNLLEMILLTSEILELKANPERHARGNVIEAQLDKGRGPVATMLVEKGTMKVGDIVVVGTTFGKVRAMNDDKGRKVKSAGPSMPVEVLGLSEVPPAGEIFVVVDDEKTAKHIADSRITKKREEDLRKNKKVSLDDLFKQIEEGEVKDLNIIIKADVQGSVEAIRQSVEKIVNTEVRVNVIHGGAGTITESDVMLAAASNAIIIGFNVRPDATTRKAAENEDVDIRLYRVIYDAIDDIKAAMTGLLAPTYKEVVLGRSEARQIFKVPKAGTIAGCMVLEGKITRTAEVRVIRDGIVIHEGKIDSLKRFKDDAKEVASGYECGIGIEKFNDLKLGDIIEAFEMEEVKRQI